MLVHTSVKNVREIYVVYAGVKISVWILCEKCVEIYRRANECVCEICVELGSANVCTFSCVTHDVAPMCVCVNSV